MKQQFVPFTALLLAPLAGLHAADYLEQAFQFAHAAAPQAELYYNDYNIEQPPKLEKTIRLVRSLQAKGVRIDAVGIQGHWLIDWPATDMIEKGIEALAATGVKVMITELDVDPLPRIVPPAQRQNQRAFTCVSLLLACR